MFLDISVLTRISWKKKYCDKINIIFWWYIDDVIVKYRQKENILLNECIEIMNVQILLIIFCQKKNYWLFIT